MGFSTKGYFPAVIDEGLYNGKYYSLPVAGAELDRVDVQHRHAKGGQHHPSRDVGAAGQRRQGPDDSERYGIALTCEPAEDTTWQWEPFFWSNGGTFHVR